MLYCLPLWGNVSISPTGAMAYRDNVTNVSNVINVINVSNVMAFGCLRESALKGLSLIVQGAGVTVMIGKE